MGMHLFVLLRRVTFPNMKDTVQKIPPSKDCMHDIAPLLTFIRGPTTSSVLSTQLQCNTNDERGGQFTQQEANEQTDVISSNNIST